MNFELITLNGVQKSSEVYEILLPTTLGPIAVFPGHEALVAVIVPGVISVRHSKQDADEKMEDFAVSGGVAETSQDKVKVLVDEASNAEEIVEEEARAALDRAIALRDSAHSQIELDQAHKMVDRQAVRLRVAELRRQHRSKR